MLLRKLWYCSGEKQVWTQKPVAQNWIKPWRLLYLHEGTVVSKMMVNVEECISAHSVVRAWCVHAAMSWNDILSSQHLRSHYQAEKRESG